MLVTIVLCGTATNSTCTGRRVVRACSRGRYRGRRWTSEVDAVEGAAGRDAGLRGRRVRRADEGGGKPVRGAERARPRHVARRRQHRPAAVDLADGCGVAAAFPDPARRWL